MIIVKNQTTEEYELFPSKEVWARDFPESPTPPEIVPLPRVLRSSQRRTRTLYYRAQLALELLGQAAFWVSQGDATMDDLWEFESELRCAL